MEDLTTLYVHDTRARPRVTCPVCEGPTHGRSFCSECRAQTEPRFIEAWVKTISPPPSQPPPRVPRVFVQVVEERMRYGGSGATLEEALDELARATRDVRPSWVREGYSLEVVVRGAGLAVSGAGPTIGAAIDEALSVLVYREGARA